MKNWREAVLLFLAMPAMVAAAIIPMPTPGPTDDFGISTNLKEVLSDKSIPEKIRKAVSDSEVWVQADFNKDGSSGPPPGLFILVGTVLDDHLVLTCHHVLAGENKSFPSIEKEPTIEIGWDGQVFPTKIVDRDPAHDLLLLEVSDPKNTFKKKPVSIKVTDDSGDRRLPWLAFGVMDRDFIVPREFTRFLGYLKSEYSTGIKGGAMILGEGVQGGFSGSGVIDQDGKFRGIVSGSYPVATVVVEAYQVLEFLENYNRKKKT